jgi:hypothetical protein
MFVRWSRLILEQLSQRGVVRTLMFSRREDDSVFLRTLRTRMLSMELVTQLVWLRYGYSESPTDLHAAFACSKSYS